MKRKALFIVILVQMSFFFQSKIVAEEIRLTLPEFVDLVKNRNLTVLENAVRVYQARTNVEVAAGNLLPSLNLWSLAKIALSFPTGLLEAIQDIAPFLVPNNWFRLEEIRQLAEVQRLSYQALWGNEILNAKALYFYVLRDEFLESLVEEQLRILDIIIESIGIRERSGEFPLGTSVPYLQRRLMLTQDRRTLNSLLDEEKLALSIAAGYEPTVDIQLTPLPPPDVMGTTPLENERLQSRVFDVSPEYREFSYLNRVADLIEQEIEFSWLGVSEISRGVNGGIFDTLPIPPGLGFGTGGSLRIARSQKRILEIQRQGIQAVLKRNLTLAVGTYNRGLESYKNALFRYNLASQILDQAMERVKAGMVRDLNQLENYLNEIIGAKVAIKTEASVFFAAEDRIHRLLYDGDYDGGLTLDPARQGGGR